jgi:hypothetical protein
VKVACFGIQLHRNTKAVGRTTCLMAREYTTGSKANLKIRASRPYIKVSGKREKEKVMDLFSTIMAVDWRVVLATI